MTPARLAAHALVQAKRAIDEDWKRCDDETGQECHGPACKVGAHRAIHWIETAQQQLDRVNKPKS